MSIICSPIKILYNNPFLEIFVIALSLSRVPSFSSVNTGKGGDSDILMKNNARVFSPTLLAIYNAAIRCLGFSRQD